MTVATLDAPGTRPETSTKAAGTIVQQHITNNTLLKSNAFIGGHWQVPYDGERYEV